MMGQIYTKVIIAESQALDCVGLDSVIRQDVGIVQTVSVPDFASLLDALGQDQEWSFAVIDLALDGLNGLAGIRWTRQKFPQLRIATISDKSDRETALAAIGAGAHGFIHKTLPVRAMVDAFLQVRDGHIFIPDDVVALPVGNPAAGRDAHVDLAKALTQRQMDVLRYLARGQSNKQIARSLGITESTVKVHLGTVFRVLGVKNRVSAAARLASEAPIAGHETPAIGVPVPLYGRRQDDVLTNHR